METAARIINNVPEVIPYQNGKPMLGWALAPIPRAIWRDKPVINLGPLIGYWLLRHRVAASRPASSATSTSTSDPGCPGRLHRDRVDAARDRTARPPGHALTLGFPVIYGPFAFSAGLSAISKGIGSIVYTSGLGLRPCCWRSPWSAHGRAPARASPCPAGGPCRPAHSGARPISRTTRLTGTSATRPPTVKPTVLAQAAPSTPHSGTITAALAATKTAVIVSIARYVV